MLSGLRCRALFWIGWIQTPLIFTNFNILRPIIFKIFHSNVRDLSCRVNKNLNFYVLNSYLTFLISICFIALNPVTRCWNLAIMHFQNTFENSNNQAYIEKSLHFNWQPCWRDHPIILAHKIFEMKGCKKLKVGEDICFRCFFSLMLLSTGFKRSYFCGYSFQAKKDLNYKQILMKLLKSATGGWYQNLVSVFFLYKIYYEKSFSSNQRKNKTHF